MNPAVPPGYPPPSGYPPPPGYPPSPGYPPGPGYPGTYPYPVPPGGPAHPPSGHPPPQPSGYPPPPGYPVPPAPPGPVEPPAPAGSSAPQPPTDAPPPPEPPSPGAPRARGWWRRNWWALPLLPALVVASVGYDIVDGYERWRKFTATEAVSSGPGEWVAYSDGRLRLRSLTEVDSLTDRQGRPVDIPSGVQVWQAVIEIDAPAGTRLRACDDILLEDAAGRTYTADPAELDAADLEYYDCFPLIDVPEGETYTVTATFVTPGGPVSGVRVVVVSELPRYAWLTPPE